MKTPEEFASVFQVDKTKPPMVPSVEQWAAITAPLEPSIIVAGAGTGKTTTMASRISYLIATAAVPPEKILGLTFTKKAARELGQAVRLRRDQALAYRLANFPANQGEADELGEPMISTYNSFGARLLKEHGLRIGIEPDARVLVDATRHQLAMRVVSRTKVQLAGLDFKQVKDVVKAVLELDSECSNYLVSPEEVIVYDQNLINRFAQVLDPTDETLAMMQISKRRIAIAEVVAQFRAAKITEGIIDYSDQIRLSAQAAGDSAEMCRMLREQFSVVLLDEYQDTSVGQKLLLHRLFGDAHPVMAVGDPCQAIYGWRGADVTNIENFVTEFTRADGSPATKYRLSVNRRSGQLILDTANSLSDPLRAIHTEIVELVAGSKDQIPAQIHTALLETFPEEVEWVCDQIQAQIAKGTPPKDIAVLLRVGKYGTDFVAGLEARNIPVQVADAGVLVHLPEVRDVLCYLELMADPTANTALVRILSGPKWRIGARDLALLGQQARKLANSDYQAEKHLPMALQLENAVGSTDAADQVCLLDALEDVATSKLAYSAPARERMIALATQLRSLRQHVGDTAIDAIARIIRETGLGVEALAKPNAVSKSHGDRLGALIDLAGSYRSLDGEAGVHAFLRFLADGQLFDNLPVGELTLTDDAVVVMTAHKSKGLEFPVVAVPMMSKDQFASKPRTLHWMTNPDKLPFALKNQQLKDPRVLGLLLCDNPDKKIIEDYKAYFNDMHQLDETRLAYVAATRAKQVLFASGSYWGTPSHKTAWGPSAFLKTIENHATTSKSDALPPVKGDKNPNAKDGDYVTWPHPLDETKFSQLQSQAQLVKAANLEGDFSELSEDELSEVANWDADISALLGLLARAGEMSRTVKLPDTLTASQLVALHKDEAEFVRTLVRPMPRKPAPEAVRGTAFHAWVEDYYGVRKLANLEEPPPGSDSPIYDDNLLAKLKQAFTDGKFAQRPPLDLEFPFALIVRQRPLIGRIDAVFAGSIDDPLAAKWTVVDWKTGAPGSADPLQLHVYRAAWAQHMDVALEQVDAAFYFVGHDEIELVTEIMTVEQLSDLI